ncbi:helix-turn-helix domain-containing protein [Agitococcus lubricus]|uniref:Homeodomain-like domain-containing protein n=1 Tax=Agitococcus lubricus TaxID=1077255 RepID=A0A2T5IWP2_9GAMM|nr:helix-turn-helix domain-containing protein [Agitococcus lubricus]PTQ88317.1 Homeodomain-like domain-containing protein [Agitococcus lubricus]
MRSESSVNLPILPVVIPQNLSNRESTKPRKVFKEQIIQFEQRGWSVWEIARKMGISRRSVQGVINESKKGGVTFNMWLVTATTYLSAFHVIEFL